jgi:acyl-CoA thioester hydrolase
MNPNPNLQSTINEQNGQPSTRIKANDLTGGAAKLSEPIIPLEELERLPLTHRQTIPESYLDAMGHMNISWYMALYNDATWRFGAMLGMDAAYFRRERTGAFALQQFVRYLAEVRVGQSVAIYTRLLGRSAKRLHVMHFMVNESQGTLASTLEMLGGHMDLTVRRMAPFPPDIAGRLDALVAHHAELDWEAPVYGVIQA